MVLERFDSVPGNKCAMSHELNYNIMRTKVREWYTQTYKTDELGQNINPQITFSDIFATLVAKEDIYEALRVGDSLIRERVFERMTELTNLEYEYFYNLWLESAEAERLGVNNRKIMIAGEYLNPEIFG